MTGLCACDCFVSDLHVFFFVIYFFLSLCVCLTLFESQFVLRVKFILFFVGIDSFFHKPTPAFILPLHNAGFAIRTFCRIAIYLCSCEVDFRQSCYNANAGRIHNHPLRFVAAAGSSQVNIEYCILYY